jgi:hypothetical protein
MGCGGIAGVQVEHEELAIEVAHATGTPGLPGPVSPDSPLLTEGTRNLRCQPPKLSEPAARHMKAVCRRCGNRDVG